MLEDPSTIQTDFDRLAGLSSPRWTHNSHYYPVLLRCAPAHIENALDIGCGKGEFSRLLARRSAQVLAVDLSPKMIETARQLSNGYANITYHIADVMQMDLSPESFDCIASIATLHHLALNNILPKLAAALKPGGALLVLDLYRQTTWSEYASSLIAFPYNLALLLLKTGRLRPDPAERRYWKLHSQHDHLLPFQAIHKITTSALPGAQLHKHLLWRYSLAWQKTSIPIQRNNST